MVLSKHFFPITSSNMCTKPLFYQLHTFALAKCMCACGVADTHK